MSNNNPKPPIVPPLQDRESMSTSSASAQKYPASTATGFQSYPEVVPAMSQPPLESYHQPHAAYAQPQYQYQNEYAPEGGQSGPQPQKRNPWGLTPLAFGLLVAAITAVIVGGAVGGGVAGAMSADDPRSSSNAMTTVTVIADPTTTPTTASALPLPSSLENYVAAEPYYVSSLSNPGCPDSRSRVDVPRDASFDLFCGVDLANGVADETNPDLDVVDVVGIFAYSITDCLYACANANYFRERWDDGFTECKGVTWQSGMAQSNSSNYANCWLKNGTSNGRQCNTCVSAKLVT